MRDDAYEKNLDSLPSLVVSDASGNLFDLPEYALPVRQGDAVVIPDKREFFALPDGSEMHMLPDRYPKALDRRTGGIKTLRTYRDRRVFAASAFIAPAYTTLYLAAYARRTNAVMLPLFAYAPLGFDGNGFVTTAIRVDKDKRQDARNFDQSEVVRRGNRLLMQYKGNRLADHIVRNCAFTYLCPAARNWVMGRWEAPLPTSTACNSACMGCISRQPEGSGVPVTQPRIAFTPAVEEITEIAVPHLRKAARPVVSFGQGCEGEPLTRARLIEEAVREMRKRTGKGTINLNTNASLPHEVERLCKAGLDSVRVSMNSAQEKYYKKYYRPRKYGFEDVMESIKIAKSMGVWVSLNYFIFPGFTDSISEMEALKKLLKKLPIDMIQMRNHNIDPDWYMETLGIARGKEKPAGIIAWMKEMKRIRPSLIYGYFNPYLG